MNRQSSSLRRPQSPACRALLALGTLLGALAGSTVAVEAQLTALGAHVLTECAGPGDCAEFDRFGFALAVCDFDDDGFDDLAVGVPGETVGGRTTTPASLHVFYGSVAGLTDTGDQVFDLDDLDLSGGADAGDHFGRALAAGTSTSTASAISRSARRASRSAAPATTPARSLVFFGSTSGLELDGFRFLSQNDLPPGSSESAESNDSFGDALAALPDGGLAIGVPDEDFVLITESDAGLIHLLSTSGPGDPLDSVVDREQNDYLDACPEGNGNEDGWGATLAVGQFGEDPSLAVAGALKAVSGEDNAGRVTVIGSPTGCFDQDRAGVLETAEELDLFGQALAAGDFDDDGFEDLAVGVPGEDLPDTADGRAGLVQVLFGSAVGLTVSGDLALSQYDFPLGQESGDSDDRFGQALAAGDFDGDGFDDLAIGVPFENVGAVVDAGAFHVAYGGSSGFVAAEGQTFHSNLPASMPDSPNTGDDLGGALATGDFDGNGIDDLAVGMSGEGLGSAAEAGAVTVLYGLDRATGGFGEVHFTSSIAVPEVTANRIVSIVRTGGAVVAASVTHSRTGGSAAPGSDFTYTSEVESWGGRRARPRADDRARRRRHPRRGGRDDRPLALESERRPRDRHAVDLHPDDRGRRRGRGRRVRRSGAGLLRGRGQRRHRRHAAPPARRAR